MHRPPVRRTRQRHQTALARRVVAQGISLVELLCTLALMVVLLGGTWPMFNDLRTGLALRATAALLETDLQFARSAAVAGGTSVRLSVLGTAQGGSCYLLYTGAANACVCEGEGRSRCEPGARMLRLEEQPGHTGITLVPLQRSILFDTSKGTVTPTATLQVIAADGRAIHQVVNIMGRVRACSPGGSMGGLQPCR